MANACILTSKSKLIKYLLALRDLTIKGLSLQICHRIWFLALTEHLCILGVMQQNEPYTIGISLRILPLMDLRLMQNIDI